MTENAGEPAIVSMRGMVVRYGSILALDSIDFDVRRGDFFALLGPNGAGKSTAIRVLTTLTRPDSGRASVGGMDVVARGLDVRRRIGVVFQTPSLDDDLTAWENMVLHARMYGIPSKVVAPRIESLLSLVDLLPKRNDVVRTFSGGMKRRLEIARALSHRPQVLFLDEPTLGLDAQTRNVMWSYLRRLNEEEGVTVFFSTHYMHEVEQFATCAAVIDHGRIVASGSVEAIMCETGARDFEAAYLSLTGTRPRDREKA